MTEQRPLISVIVPVYRTERYIHRCVDSILAQTYDNLEIILVDDGSPDRCGAICDEYAQQDGRIKVIHKANGGLSSARNAALDIAAGEYIGFVDSDDYIFPAMYERLYALINEYGADAAECGAVNLYGDRFAEERACVYETPEGIMRAMLQSLLAISVCVKLYRAALWQGVRMPEGLYYEDMHAFLDIARLSKRHVRTGERLYYYEISNASITRTAPTHKHLTSSRALLGLLAEYADSTEENRADAAMFLCTRILSNYGFVSGQRGTAPKAELKQYQRELYSMFKSYLPEARQAPLYAERSALRRVEWLVFRCARFMYMPLLTAYSCIRNKKRTLIGEAVETEETGFDGK